VFNTRSQINFFGGAEKFMLDDVDLTGSIPTTLGLLTNLFHLSVAHSAITGTLPSEIGQLSKLQYLGFVRTTNTDACGMRPLLPMVLFSFGFSAKCVLHSLVLVALVGHTPPSLGLFLIWVSCAQPCLLGI
jgi:hypothetical protein